MLKRYLEISNALPKLAMPEMEYLLPDKDEHKQIKALCKQLSNIDSITKRLHEPSTTITVACVLLDGIIYRFRTVQSMCDRLSANAEFVETSPFESALIKVQDGYKHKLTAAGKRLYSTFWIRRTWRREPKQQGGT